jgi:Permuted papain-like amidase enzyme, YaeF/YiiX, C92 family
MVLHSKILAIVIFSFLLVTIGCQTKPNNSSIIEGDILFQNLDCGPLCDAIEQVTDGYNHRKFSHCGLVTKDNDSLKILEAIGSSVTLTPLHKFLLRSNDTASLQNIIVGRAKPQYQQIVGNAVAFAKGQIGVGYDDEFLMNNNKWYCSELMYEAFKKANNNVDFFSLAPMTFKDPNTNQFSPAWVAYYKNLNAPIPQGQLGINPGGMSTCNKIDILDIKKL